MSTIPELLKELSNLLELYANEENHSVKVSLLLQMKAILEQMEKSSKANF